MESTERKAQKPENFRVIARNTTCQVMADIDGETVCLDEFEIGKYAELTQKELVESYRDSGIIITSKQAKVLKYAR